MFLDRKPFIHAWAPLYGIVFERGLWRFAAWVGGIFFADGLRRLDRLEARQRAAESRIESIQAQTDRVPGLLDRCGQISGQQQMLRKDVQAALDEQARQWEAVERLLLAFLSGPSEPPSGPGI